MELKFKAKVVADGIEQWLFFNLPEMDNGLWAFPVDKDVHHIDEYLTPLLLFTGMKDKNGTEIYRGDILSYKSAHPKHNGKVFNNVVEFATGQSLCGWRMRNKSCIVKATPYKFVISEIIGNIYENPELLETKKAQLSEQKVE